MNNHNIIDLYVERSAPSTVDVTFSYDSDPGRWKITASIVNLMKCVDRWRTLTVCVDPSCECILEDLFRHLSYSAAPQLEYVSLNAELHPLTFVPNPLKVKKSPFALRLRYLSIKSAPKLRSLELLRVLPSDCQFPGQVLTELTLEPAADNRFMKFEDCERFFAGFPALESLRLHDAIEYHPPPQPKKLVLPNLRYLTLVGPMLGRSLNFPSNVVASFSMPKLCSLSLLQFGTTSLQGVLRRLRDVDPSLQTRLHTLHLTCGGLKHRSQLLSFSQGFPAIKHLITDPPSLSYFKQTLSSSVVEDNWPSLKQLTVWPPAYQPESDKLASTSGKNKDIVVEFLKFRSDAGLALQRLRVVKAILDELNGDPDASAWLKENIKKVEEYNIECGRRTHNQFIV